MSSIHFMNPAAFKRDSIMNKVANAPVAQLDRAAAYGAVGWGFDSLRVHITRSTLVVNF